MQAVEIESLVKRYSREGAAAVDGIDLTIVPGELMVLLGPSGCGKTTLLRCIAGLETPDAGRITLGGRAVFDAGRGFSAPTHKRDIGMVFQNYSLFPHMSVRRNVAYPLEARRFPSERRAQRVRDVLEIVQCEGLAERLPAMLSGGQQQRVALARALAPQPAVMLLDEPLSNLDALLRIDLRAQLRALHRELGFTGIYVTHDQGEAFNLGTRIAVMRAGRMEQLGSAEEVYARPASEYVAKFLGIRNVLALNRTSGAWSSDVGPLGGNTAQLAGGEASRAYIRPEHLELAPAGSAARPSSLLLPEGVVTDVLYGGGEVDYVVRIGSKDLFAKVPGSRIGFHEGERVSIRVDRANLLVYDGKSAESASTLPRSSEPAMSEGSLLGVG